MKNVPLPKLIKWVLSGAIHPIVIFQRVHAGSDYLDLGTVFRIYAQFRHLYKTQAHYDRHVSKIFGYILFPPSALRKLLDSKGTFPYTENYSKFIVQLFRYKYI